MPYKNPADKRAYLSNYQASEKEKKKRARRNAARRAMIKAGKAKKGDGRDVHHVKPLAKGGTNAKSNLKVTARGKNRGHNIGPKKNGTTARRRKG